MTGQPGSRGARRQKWMSIGLLACSAFVVLLVGGRPRPSADALDSAGATSPPAVALALVVLAGVAALSLLGQFGRRLVCALIALAGMGIIAAVTVLDRGPSGSLEEWIGVGAAVVLLGAAAWSWRRSPTWPDSRSTPAGAMPAPTAKSRPGNAWDLLDRGEDPTA